jgi:hypothetical protein
MTRLSINRLLGCSAIPLLCAATVSWAQDEPDFQIEYSGSAQAIVVEYDVESAIEKTDDEPLLRVYGDGRVRVHRQPYRQNAGDYEMKLSEDDLAGLLQFMHDNGAMTYDAKAVGQSLHAAKTAQAEAARAGTGLLQHRSDVELTIVRINLNAYRASAGAALQTDLQKEIRCVDLQHEAQENPQIAALQGMANVGDALDALTNDTRLRKVGDGQ